MNTSSQTDRRSFLASGSLAVAALITPPWIARRFGASEQEHETPRAKADRLDEAMERARQVGKPLMVILVPEKALRSERGFLWGDLFAFASDEAMADFALCEWTCIESAELATRFESLRTRATRNVVAVLIETNVERAQPILVSFIPSEIERRENFGFPSDEMRERAERLASVLRKRIVSEEHTLESRTGQCFASLSPGTPSVDLPNLEAGQRPKLQAVDRLAARFRTAGGPAAKDLPRRITLLSQAFAARVWDHDPDGARWQTEHIDPCPPCGMGYVGPTSRHFLEFYTAESRR